MFCSIYCHSELSPCHKLVGGLNRLFHFIHFSHALCSYPLNRAVVITAESCFRISSRIFKWGLQNVSIEAFSIVRWTEPTWKEAPQVLCDPNDSCYACCLPQIISDVPFHSWRWPGLGDSILDPPTLSKTVQRECGQNSWLSKFCFLLGQFF